MDEQSGESEEEVMAEAIVE